MDLDTAIPTRSRIRLLSPRAQIYATLLLMGNRQSPAQTYRIDAGADLERHIDDVRVMGTVTRVPTVIYAFERGGHLTLRTLEVGCGKSIAPALLEIAQARGIDGRTTGPCGRQMDTFPLEDIFPN